MYNESSNLVIDALLGSNDDVKLILRVLKSLRSLLRTTKKLQNTERIAHCGDLLNLLHMNIFLDFDTRMKTYFYHILQPGHEN